MGEKGVVGLFVGRVEEVVVGILGGKGVVGLVVGGVEEVGVVLGLVVGVVGVVGEKGVAYIIKILWATSAWLFLGDV